MDSIDLNKSNLDVCRDKCQAWCCKNKAIVYTSNGEINIKKHTCDKLKDDNECSMYEDRPGCRDYDCSLLAYFERLKLC